MVCSPGGADQSVEVEVAEPVAELADVADEALFEGLGDGLGERRRPRGLVRSSRRSARFSKPLAMFHNRLAVLFRPWLPHLTGGRGGGGLRRRLCGARVRLSSLALRSRLLRRLRLCSRYGGRYDGL